jgi:aerotaxis receptor
MAGETVLDDSQFLVSETDSKGKILFANDDFCRVAEYDLKDLLGKPHNVVRHPDMPKAAFADLWKTVQSGNVWTGYVKNATKSGGYYWVFATVYPFESCDGGRGFISCRRKASREEIERYTKLYQQMKAKE